MKKILGLCLLSVLLPMNGYAQSMGSISSLQDEKFVTISKVEVVEIFDNSDLDQFEEMVDKSREDFTNPLGGVIVILDSIINIGEKIWKIVEANKPTVELKLVSANAVPEGITDWQQLENWEMPKSTRFKVGYKNGYGSEVVSFEFRVVYIYGGSYEGAGQYLTNVMVTPVNVDVSWGFKFNASVEIPAIINRGTKENPMAGMQVLVNWSIKTPIKQSNSSEVFFVQGDGLIQKM